jgi:hypothetical protein
VKGDKALLILSVIGLILIGAAGPGVSAMPTPIPPPGPPGPAETPHQHEVHGATSVDGLTFTEIPDPFFKEASVPDVVEVTVSGSQAAPPGTLLLYFVDFSNAHAPNQETIAMSTSTDGMNWTEKTTVVVQGNSWPIAVDPTVVELPDGRIRLYFYGADFSVPDPPEHVFLSAVSEDGIHFEVEPGVRLSAPGITDPQVRRAGDEWVMSWVSPNGLPLARSQDGLEFTVDERFAFVPGSVMMPDGIVRVFERGDGGAIHAVHDFDLSGPGTGEGWRPAPGEDVKNIGDASCIRRLDGTYYMVIKVVP